MFVEKRARLVAVSVSYMPIYYYVPIAMYGLSLFIVFTVLFIMYGLRLFVVVHKNYIVYIPTIAYSMVAMDICI